MNFIALNQNILNKGLIIGAGPKEGTATEPTPSPEGIKVYLNGKHAMPSHDELEQWFEIGSMIHPYAMSGMPDASGEISYEFWVTKKEYIIVVRLQLDEEICGVSDPAADILSLTKKNMLPKKIEASEKNFHIISREMMLDHLDSLFEFYDDFENLKDWIFQDDALQEFIKYHFESKKIDRQISNK